MERLTTRSRRRAFTHAAVAGLVVAAGLPAIAAADKPASAGNGPPGPAGNPNHGQPHPGRGQAPQPPAPRTPPPSQGRAVRAHGAPAAQPEPPRGRAPAASPRPARPQRSAAPRPSAPPAAGERRSQGGKGRGPHGNNGAAHQKTTICHATHSDTNPYVEITISDRALKAHGRHQDGEDIIPAPAGGCPSAAQSAAVASVMPFAEALGAVVAGAPVDAGGSPAAAPRDSRPAGREGAAAVLGAVQTSAGPDGSRDDGPAAGAASAQDPAAEGSDDGSLPFTGLELLLVLAVGVALLLTGFAMRRAAVSRRTHA